MRMSKALGIIEKAMAMTLKEMKQTIKLEDYVGLGGLLVAMGDTAANLRESGAKVEEHEEEEK
jgi:D-tyrosyl-tRNA(Tyr) deacylase